MAYSPVSSVSTITKLVVLPAPETAKKNCKQCTDVSSNTHFGHDIMTAAVATVQCAFCCCQIEADLQVAVLQHEGRPCKDCLACTL